MTQQTHIRELFPCLQVIPVAVDVRDPEAVGGAAQLCVDSCGSLPHMVVNNAAGNFVSPTERLSANAFRTFVDIVLNGTANVTLEFGKRLIAANQGCLSLVARHQHDHKRWLAGVCVCVSN